MRTLAYQQQDVPRDFARAGRRELSDLNCKSPNNFLFSNPAPASTKLAEPSLSSTTYDRSSKACFDARSNPYRPKFREEDFSSPRLRLLRSKKDIAKDIDRDFKNPLTKNENSAFVHGPLGARVSDVILDRAVKQFDQEKAKITEDGFSNVVILGKGKLSCHLMARRLLRMVDPEKRPELAEHIEVLDTYKPKITNGDSTQPSPKIIFIPLDTLSGVLSNETDEARRKRETKYRSETAVTRDLSELRDYIGKDRVKYFYFDKAHLMGSASRYILLSFFLRNMDDRQKTGVKEIIGTSFCNDYYTDGDEDDEIIRVKAEDDSMRIADVKSSLDRWYYMDSPEGLTNFEIPTFREPDTFVTNIGRELPPDKQVKGKSMNWVYGRDYADNEEWITEYFAPVIKKYLDDMREEGRTNPRILISVEEIGQMDLLRKILQDEYKLPVAWTNGKENKYLSLKGDDLVEHSETERIDLVDKFGKDFNILIHCKVLEGEEIPADTAIALKVPRTSSRLEALLASARTPFDDEENSQIFNARPRNTWLLEVGKPFHYNGEDTTVLDLYYGINARHQKREEAHGDKRGQIKQDHGLGLGLEGLSPADIMRLKNLRATDYDPYYESVRVFGGNPHWLKFLDTVVMPDPSPEADAKLVQAKTTNTSTIDTKINELAERTVSFLCESDPILYEDLTTQDLVAIIRGKESRRKDKRELLIWALEHAQSNVKLPYIIANYPSVTGIETAEEARGCIDTAFAENPTGQACLTDNSWFSNLSWIYGSPEAFRARIGDFFFNANKGSRRIYLYDPKLLKEAVAVLAGASTSLDGNANDAQSLMKDFLRFVRHDENFSVVAASEAKPESFKLPDDILRSRARNDVRFIMDTRQITPNPEWMQVLGSALGIPVADAQRRMNYISDYLYDRHNAYFRSSVDLEFALRALTGAELDITQMEQARKLLREFVTHVNNHATRLRPHDLNKLFPETFALTDALGQGQERLSTIEQSLRIMPVDSNSSKWLAIVDAVVPNPIDRIAARASLYDQYIASLPRAEQKTIFENRDSLHHTLNILEGRQKIKVHGGEAHARILLRGFFEFLRTNYPDRFNLHKAYNLYSLIDIEALVRSDVSVARRICVWASDDQKLMEGWVDLLDRACAINPASAREARASLIADYMLETGQVAAFKDPSDICSILLNPNIPKPDASTRNQVRNFVSWVNARTGQTIDPGALTKLLPQYFGFTDLRQDRTNLRGLIHAALDHEVNSNTGWLAFVDAAIQSRTKTRTRVNAAARSEYLTDFLLNDGSKYLAQIKTEADLHSCLNTLLACEGSQATRKQEATRSLFADFALQVKKDFPGLSRARINQFFPEAVSNICSDIVPDDTASVLETVDASLSRREFGKSSNNQKWLALVKRSIQDDDDTPEKLYNKILTLITSFFCTQGRDYLASDDQFLNALRTLMGLSIKKENTSKLLLDFIDFINTRDPDTSPIQRFEAYACFGDLIPINAEQVRSEIAFRYKPRPATLAEHSIPSGEVSLVRKLEESLEYNNIVDAENSNTDDDVNASEALLIEQPKRAVTILEDDSALVKDICDSYGVTEATLFGFFPAQAIDPDIWTSAIREIVCDSFVLPNSRPATREPPSHSMSLESLFDLAKRPPTGPLQLETIPDPQKVAKSNRNKLIAAIEQSIIKGHKGSVYLTETFRKRQLLRKIFPDLEMFKDSTLGHSRPTTFRAKGRGDYQIFIEFYMDRIIFWINEGERTKDKGRKYICKIVQEGDTYKLEIPKKPLERPDKDDLEVFELLKAI